jgi:hypothetical protein
LREEILIKLIISLSEQSNFTGLEKIGFIYSYFVFESINKGSNWRGEIPVGV